MTIISLLKRANLELTDDLAAVFAKAIKDIYPNFYLNSKNQMWSDWKIARYILNLDLPQVDVDCLLNRATKYGNIWAFS